MRWFKENMAELLWGIVLAAACALILYTFQSFQMDDSRLRLSDVADFSSEWMEKGESGWTRLHNYEKNENYTVSEPTVLAKRLPENLDFSSAILFLNQNVSVSAYLDGQWIDSFGVEENPRFGTFFGAVWQLIELPDGAGGALLTLEVDSPSRGMLGSPTLGTRDALILHVFWGLLPRILCCFLLILVGLVELLYTLYQWRARARRGRADLYFGVFALTAALWIATDGLIPQFISGNRAAWFYTSVYSFLLLPAVFALYVHAQLNAYRRMFHGVSIAFCLQALLGIVLALFGVGFIESGALTLAHATLGVEIALILWACVKKRESLEAREILIAMLCLLFTCVVALAIFYLTIRRGNHAAYGNVFLLGLFVFCSLLAVSRVQGSLRTAKQALQSEYYEKQAYTDLLTGLGNYAAYERAAKKIGESARPLTVMMFDLNNLKEINDSHGHAAGDQLLIDAAACLKRAFREGEVYRLGGDEFAALFPGVDARAAALALERFAEAIARHNSSSHLAVRIACGAASRDGVEPDLKALMRLADQNMYANKRAEKEREENAP